MDFAKVSVEVRESSGKGGAHRVRAAGKVPGVLYVRQSAPVPVSFDSRLLLKSLDKERRRNTVFTLTLNQPGATSGGEEITAKDFHTWAATTLAAATLAGLQRFDSKAAAKKEVLRAVERVVKRIEKTPAIRREWCSQPDVVVCYLNLRIPECL